MVIDVAIQAGLGRFFAAKFRSGVLYRIYEKTGDRDALQESLKKYREARTAWAEIVKVSKPVYKPDITVGEHVQLRGHWADRLAAIDTDIALVAKQLDSSRKREDSPVAAIHAALARPKRSPVACTHTPPMSFRPGQPIDIGLSVAKSGTPLSARLYYRRVNHAERYQTAEMEATGGRHRATIPGAYTDSPYPLAYYFEFKQGTESAWLFPGFGSDLANQPYYVIRRA